MFTCSIYNIFKYTNDITNNQIKIFIFARLLIIISIIIILKKIKLYV